MSGLGLKNRKMNISPSFRTCMLDNEMVFMDTVHLKKESLDEAQAAIDFFPYRKEHTDARFIYTQH